MLKLPPPPFPTRFQADDSDQEAVGDFSVRYERWPEERDGGDGVGEGTAGRARWDIIKTQEEQYIETLEQKLQRLGNGPSVASISNPDSGYGSHPMSTKTGPEPGPHADDRGDDAEYGSSEDEDTRAQRPLLDRHEGDHSMSESDSIIIHHTPDESPEKRVAVIPATPAETDEGDSGAEDDEGEEEARLTAAGPSDNRRISFSNSVRISGGIRTSTRPHRHRRPLPEVADMFTPAEALPRGPRRSASAASHASSLSSSRAASPSRPPGVALSRDGSFSSSLLPLHHQTTGGTATYSFYSSSPGSQLPSRSSSPCSSIYAPLQASKKHCPSPMLVQPPRRLQDGTLSFKDYLRGREGSMSESDEDVVRGYRELVEQQRRKRERWDHRRRHRRARLSEVEDGDEDEEPALGFWSRVGELLAIGAAGTGNRGAMIVNYGATTQGLAGHGQKPRTGQARSRLSISSDADSDDSEGEDGGLLKRVKVRSSRRSRGGGGGDRTSTGAASDGTLVRSWRWLGRQVSRFLWVFKSCLCMLSPRSSPSEDDRHEYSAL